MEHQPSLLPDYTMFIQMGLFLLSWVILHFLVLKPYAHLLHKRHEATDGLKESAHVAREKALKLKTDYEEYMKQERKKISAWLEEERRKISDEQRAIVQTARSEVATLLQKNRTEIQADLEKARKELLPEVSKYSTEIVNKLVGGKVKLALTKDVMDSASADMVAG